MEPALEGHRRYLAAMRRACERHPRVHSHQLAALDREISLAAAAGDAAGYQAAGGDLFELTRAAWLDRAANHARVAVAVGDPWRAEAAAVEHAEALGATGHDDWTDHVAAGGVRAAPLRARSGEARSAFTSLLLCLIRVHSSGSEVERAELGNQAAGAYVVLREADPGFAWRDLPHLPRYLWRTPWTGGGREVVGDWIDELGFGDRAAPDEVERSDPLADIEAGEERWRSELAHRAPGATSQPEASADEVVASYRGLAASLTADDRASVATRGAAEALAAAAAEEPTAQDALARFVEAGLSFAFAAAPLRAHAQEALERQAVWPDPLVEHHWRTLLDRLDEARTETELDLISVHADACFAVEADWNVVLLSSLFTPLRAACFCGWEGSEEARIGLERAAAATYALLGLGPRSLLGVPRAADFVARILVPRAAGDSGPLGAFEGEGGFELLGEAETWILAARDRGEPDLSEAADIDAALHALFERARLTEPAPRPRPVTLWGALIEPGDLVPALARPNRPPIPGTDAVATAGSGL